MKQTIFFLLILLSINFVQADIRDKVFKDGHSENDALQRAYWSLFELALKAEMGDLMAESSVTNSFKKDFKQDFFNFKDKYFKDTLERCFPRKVGNGYKCSVLATVDMTKVRVLTKTKSSSVGKYTIVILRDKKNDASLKFAKYIQRRLNKSGHQIRLFDIKTKVGALAKKCQRDNRKYSNKFKSSDLPNNEEYKDMLEQYEAKIAYCKKYLNVDYEIKINKVKITPFPYHKRFQEMQGELDYNITFLNSQSGEKENSLIDQNITASGFNYNEEMAASELENELFLEASAVIAREMNELFMNRSSQPVNNSDSYQYTVIIKGLSVDRASRKKAKLVRNIIKKYYQVLAPKLDHRASNDSKKIYRIAVQQEIDLENVIDALYDEVERKGYHNTTIKMDQNRAIIVVFKK